MNSKQQNRKYKRERIQFEHERKIKEQKKLLIVKEDSLREHINECDRLSSSNKELIVALRSIKSACMELTTDPEKVYFIAIRAIQKEENKTLEK